MAQVIVGSNPTAHPKKIMDTETIKIIKKLDLVYDAVRDWKTGKLTDLSAFIAIKIIVAPKKPSKECKEWAKSFIGE